MEKEIEQLLDFIQEEPVHYSINPTCQEILQSDFKASKKVTKLVNLYLQEHPEFVPLEEEFMHPSCLALHRQIKPWLFSQCEDPVEFWSLMLAAAKEWFPEKEKTKLGHAFCVRFEIEDCTWWNGWEPIQPVVKDYMEWRYNKQKTFL